MKLVEKIYYILTDNKSGSSDINKKIIQSLLDYCKKHKIISKIELIETLNLVFSKFNQFAILYHFINYLFQNIENKYENNKYIESEELYKIITVYRANWNSVNNRIGTHLKKLIEFNNYKNVLLHSNSTTIIESFAFLSAQKIKLNIYQTVSSPFEEGKIQAKKLAVQNHNVNLIIDSAFGKFSDKIDFVILGADVVFEQSFINKIGSLLISEIMNLNSIPIYVLFDSRKFISNSCSHQLIDSFKTEILKPPEEIWKNAPLNIQIHNYYFEKIPNKLVNSFIMEDGIFVSKNIHSIKYNPYSKYFST